MNNMNKKNYYNKDLLSYVNIANDKDRNLSALLILINKELDSIKIELILIAESLNNIMRDIKYNVNSTSARKAKQA